MEVSEANKDGMGASEHPTREWLPLDVRKIVANRYEIRSKLGTGGIGEVWLAYDLKLRVDVALKSLRFDHRMSAEAMEALRREVRTAREVISPNVCRIFDLVVEDDQELISMEYVDGRTLMALLLQKGSLALDEARNIAAQFLAGLEAIHQAGFVHRDLKPENIMITRTGRVVVMDFGIARDVKQLSGSIAGTLAYMSPEQLNGDVVDARSDLYSAGIVLAEMIHPDGILSHKTREEIWDIVRHDPRELPDHPWKSVISRVLTHDPTARFASAGAMSRALEEATERLQTIEERSPYPGLASFSSADSQFFLGREMEVETLFKKVQQMHLMALVGPSGSGKTSFLRAGLIPALPDDWNCIFTVPGDTPLLNLAQTLASPLSGDTEAVQRLLRFDDNDTALWLFNCWRRKHREVLLIVDRFEELFTLNRPEIQAKFADLIANAALQSDVRVLLSIRDDFLMRCYDYPSLAPIFSELTPLGPLSGPSLRRVLVQPALKCGYTFEDNELVDEIIADLDKERGALPLLAFAAARLWEKRDRERNVLTRKGYREIGSVGGALAQHAENTVERIGEEAIVRELFRNLVTSENTRIARDKEELLSVFAGRERAERVITALIDARLLTSYEAPRDEGSSSRVEIIHESLLSAWPRLIRWRTQDADGAQLHDQLRQAAQLWHQRNRSEDLVWTGTDFLEFQAWKERYSGGLTSIEEAFARAMADRANKKRKQRRFAVTAIFVVLLVILGLITNFWRKATIARDNAVQEARRADAARLLTLGRAKAAESPGTKLAYAIASLESADSADGRMFAMEALSEGGAALVKHINPALSYITFSPDDRWLLITTVGGGMQLLSKDGASMQLPLKQDTTGTPEFSPDGRFLLWRSPDAATLQVWSLDQKKIERTFRMEGRTAFAVRDNKAFFVTAAKGTNELILRSWGFNSEEPQIIGTFQKGKGRWDIDPTAQFLAYGRDKSIYLRKLESANIGSEELVGKHDVDTLTVKFHPTQKTLAASDVSGAIRLWPLASNGNYRTIAEPGSSQYGAWVLLWFNRTGSALAGGDSDQTTRLQTWLLDAPPGAVSDPLRYEDEALSWVTFDHSGRWMAIAWTNTIAFYPLGHREPYRFRGNDSGSFNVRFTPDGKHLINGFRDGILQWSLPGQPPKDSRTLWKRAQGAIQPIDVDPAGNYVLAGTNNEGDDAGIHLISINDGKDVRLQSCLPGTIHDSVSFSPDGKLAAAVAVHDLPDITENHGIQIWELESGRCRVLEPSKGKPSFCVKFAADGTLFSGDNAGNIYRWDLQRDSFRVIGKGKGIVTSIAITPDARYAAAAIFNARKWSELATSEVIVYDLGRKTSHPITSHGNRVYRLAFDPSGQKLVSGDLEGVVRVGSKNGESPHLLLGHASVGDVAVSPDGRWIASTDGSKGEVRLWPMPDAEPFHLLPYETLLSKLRALTTARIIKNERATTGYDLQHAKFPGWENVPEW